MDRKRNRRIRDRKYHPGRLDLETDEGLFLTKGLFKVVDNTELKGIRGSGPVGFIKSTYDYIYCKVRLADLSMGVRGLHGLDGVKGFLKYKNGVIPLRNIFFDFGVDLDIDNSKILTFRLGSMDCGLLELI